MTCCQPTLKKLEMAIRKMMNMVDSISPKLYWDASNTGNKWVVLKDVLKDFLVNIEYEAQMCGIYTHIQEERGDHLAEELQRLHVAGAAAEKEGMRIFIEEQKVQIAELKRTLEENEARYKELLDAARASSLRGAELERENELLKDELAENEARYKTEGRGLLAAQVAYTEHANELEQENRLLNEQITTQARWEELTWGATAYEWMSPQGISFCLDNGNIYGAGRGALWYFDEEKGEWMTACWIGEDQDIKQAYREEIERQTSTVDFLEKELKEANERCSKRENLLLKWYHSD